MRGECRPDCLFLSAADTPLDLSERFKRVWAHSRQLWEIRLKGKAGIARAIYVTVKEQRVVIVRAFIKKTEKTPTGEIDLALQRAKELKP